MISVQEEIREYSTLNAWQRLERSKLCGVAKHFSNSGSFAIGKFSKIPPPLLLITKAVKFPLSCSAKSKAFES